MGKDNRKNKTGGKAVAYSCRNNGTCSHCTSNRMYNNLKRIDAANHQINEADICNKCGGESKSSKGFGNAYSTDQNGIKTIIPGRGDLINCKKCKDCGHSWVPNAK